MATPEAEKSSLNGEDWELVSGSKSLPILEDKTESSAKDPEDWYKTIPATPANTPEYTPLPPPYPQVPPEAELEPIQEVPEEQVPNSTELMEKPSDVKNPTKSDESIPEDKKVIPETEAFGFNASNVARLVVYITLFYIIKQIVGKLWQRFRGSSLVPASEKTE